MTFYVLDLLRAVMWYGKIRSGPVLEIGSFIEEHQEHLDIRQAFPPGTPYVGVDVNEGSGVDKVVDLFNVDAMSMLVKEVKPSVILCLYVLEHVWEIRRAAEILCAMWKEYPEAWLWIGTHQNQPFHGTEKYPDYWRITGEGMHRMMEEAGMDGVMSILVSPDSSNPSDVMAIRQPASMSKTDLEEILLKAMRAAPSAKWDMLY